MIAFTKEQLSEVMCKHAEKEKNRKHKRVVSDSLTISIWRHYLNLI